MADRIRHINTRNLVVCETFDDFAEAVRNTDFTVEDVVGYVTSLTNNYYWLNIESVWGAIGFTWIPSSLVPLTDEEALQYPNPLYRIEQVTAEGVNIPMDNQWLIDHKLSKGTGIFNRTTIPFSHIPTVPDGHRITAITGTTLANINPDITTLYIDKSDWRNLKNISSIISTSRTIYADLDGSAITNITPLFTSAGKLYLKADLSELQGVYSISRRGVYGTGMIFAANDYYSGLNIPLTDNNTNYVQISTSNYGYLSGCPTFQWEGNGPFELEHWFNIIDYSNVYAAGGFQVYSLNNQYHFNNIKYASGSTASFHFTPNTANMENTEITIDCTNGVSDVIIDYDLTWRGDTGFNSSTISLKPINYIGNVTSIGTYNPYLKIENDEWPEFNQSLVNKLNPDLGEFIFKGIKIVNLTRKCPYTIDARNLNRIRIFDYGNATFADNFENKVYGSYNDFYPTIIVDESKIYDSVRVNVSVNQDCVFPFTKITAKSLYIGGAFGYGNHGFLLGDDVDITVSNLSTQNYNFTIRVYDSTKPIITLKKLSEDSVINNINYIGSKVIGDYTNVFKIDATDVELMEGGNITTLSIVTSEMRHPFVLCKRDMPNENSFANIHYTNFRLIWRSSLTLTYNSYTTSELQDFVDCFRAKDNDIRYDVNLQDYIYDALSQAQRESIIAKGYTVVRRS